MRSAARLPYLHSHKRLFWETDEEGTGKETVNGSPSTKAVMTRLGEEMLALAGTAP